MKMYDNMIEELDGVDNGVSCYPADIKPKYTVSSTLAQRVGRLNPYWNQVTPQPFPTTVLSPASWTPQPVVEPGCATIHPDHLVEQAATNPALQEGVQDMDERFAKAMETAGSEFLDMANYYVHAWMPAREVVKKALDSRMEADPSGQVNPRPILEAPSPGWTVTSP